MMDIMAVTPPDKAPPSLDEQRAVLRMKLERNRRVLIHQFSDEEAENHFPRSMVMRFLTQQTTLHILKKLAYTAIGVKTFTSLQYGFSFAQFVRSAFTATKKAHAAADNEAR